MMSSVEPETILVVEDEPIIRMLVVDHLNDLGYSTLEAKDGPDALRLIDGPGRIELMLTDIGLPGMNGRELAEAARRRRPELKILFATGYTDDLPDSTHGELNFGIVDKPFDMDILAAKVRGLIGESEPEFG